METEITATAPMRVMVVDDNRDAALTLTRLLKVLGFSASAAFSGQAALEQIELDVPSLIFLDLGMPGMDGIETASKIRATPCGAGIKLVALTGLGRQEDMDLTRAAGFEAHLVKPVNLPLLEQTLSNFVGYQPQHALHSQTS